MDIDNITYICTFLDDYKDIYNVYHSIKNINPDFILNNYFKNNKITIIERKNTINFQKDNYTISFEKNSIKNINDILTNISLFKNIHYSFNK
jgi:hypothetical protein